MLTPLTRSFQTASLSFALNLVNHPIPFALPLLHFIDGAPRIVDDGGGCREDRRRLSR
jgi:hypothetical protein